MRTGASGQRRRPAGIDAPRGLRALNRAIAVLEATAPAGRDQAATVSAATVSAVTARLRAEIEWITADTVAADTVAADSRLAPRRRA